MQLCYGSVVNSDEFLESRFAMLSSQHQQQAVVQPHLPGPARRHLHLHGLQVDGRELAAEQQVLPGEIRRAYQNDRRLVMIGVGLIATWCVLQYLGVLLT